MATKQPAIHVMVDLETLGVGVNPVITRIAAIVFDLQTGKTYDEFDESVSPKSCLDVGLQTDTMAVNWWLKQDPDTVQEVLVGSMTSGKPLHDVLERFTDMLNKLKQAFRTSNVLIWGNGIPQDNTWLTSAFTANNMKLPWHHSQHRDMRTLIDLCGQLTGYNMIEDKKTFAGNRHHALDDCRNQIRLCVNAYNALQNAIDYVSIE